MLKTGVYYKVEASRILWPRAITNEYERRSRIETWNLNVFWVIYKTKVPKLTRH